MQRQPIHVLLMGESGVGKDTFAATFPGPRLVWHLDGYGQDMPYIDNMILGRAQSVSDFSSYQMGNAVITYRDVVDARGELTRIEYYSSDNATMPNMAQVLETRMSYFSNEQANWKTLICGSLSSAALESRLSEQFVLNPSYKDPRKWYGAATEYIERLVFQQKALKINTVFICHIGRQMDEVAGEMLYTPDLPGRLSYSAARYFPEMYRLFVMVDGEGKRQRVLQTDHDGRFQAKNHIRASNPCWPNYEALWSNWDRV